MLAVNLFKKIIDREIPAKIAYEDDQCLAFHDINPQSPTHVLIIPRQHLPSLNDASETDPALLGRLFLAAREVAARLGVAAGYRVVTNCGTSAGQSVFHLHFHLLGGRPMLWPPG